MKIAYATEYDALDIHQWSGTGYYIGETLKEISDSIEYIGKLKETYRVLFGAKQFLYKHTHSTKYMRNREPLIAKGYAQQIAQRLSKSKADIVVSPGTVSLAYLECKQKSVFWTDATFAGMLEFYPGFSNLCSETIRNGNFLEQQALDRCSLAIYASDWAAKTAVEYYNVNPEKVKVVPFGANICCSRTWDDVKSMINSKDMNKCKLTFIGVEWFRKGGDLALEVAEKLNNAGLDTELTVIGCQPQVNVPLPDYVKPMGFISKASPEGIKQIDKILSDSHFLIVPSQAECYGIVFCEASSFGVPSLSRAVGGIPTVIRDDLNGKTFANNTSADQYANYILELFNNFQSYKQLALSSFNEFSTRLNWSSAGQAIKELLKGIA